MDNAVQVSGAIFAIQGSSQKEGESYVIRSKNGSGWGLPVNELEPEDLRALANRIEAARA